MSTEKRSALVLVAHADDESLGCGGTIPKLVRDGWAVDVVILSDGVVSARGDTIQDNRADADAACRVLGVGPPTILGFRDQFFDDVPMAELANSVFELGLQPDLILTHADTDLNSDHRLVAEVAKIIGRPRRKPVSILACEVPGTTMWNGQVFPGNYYVDISDTLDLKLEAFSKYGNEIQEPPGTWSLSGIELLARYHGMQVGVAAAESFVVVRAMGGLLP